MPRLVKTVTEMEGRFEEKWVLVEEDGIVGPVIIEVEPGEAANVHDSRKDRHFLEIPFAVVAE